MKPRWRSVILIGMNLLLFPPVDLPFICVINLLVCSFVHIWWIFKLTSWLGFLKSRTIFARQNKKIDVLSSLSYPVHCQYLHSYSYKTIHATSHSALGTSITFWILGPPAFEKNSIHWFLEAICICLCLCVFVFVFVFFKFFSRSLSSQDDKLSENIWFGWYGTSCNGYKWRMGRISQMWTHTRTDTHTHTDF